MTIYTVLSPPAETGSAGPDPDSFVFVKEGFCWPALYITAIWLLWRRMWLAFILYLAAAAAVLTLAAKMAPPVAVLTVLLFGFLVALEANNLRRWTLERRGYRFIGVASGDRRSDAEFRFFAGFAGSGPERPPVEPAKPATAAWAETREVVGLFPNPGGTP
jgi:hypothetical protein